MIIIVLRILPTARPRPWVWDNITCTSGNGLDPIGGADDFLSKAHYFVQLLEDMILTLNI